jgi:DNA polymerase III delta prime subunit
MNTRILIMGLPGSGKTTIADILKKKLEEYNNTIVWLNADEIRKKYNDWDFSREGRIRQSQRMRELSESSNCDFVIADFVAPLAEMRNNFKADWTIWMDTINQGRFEDTNQMFIKPDVYDFRVTELNAEKWADFIASHILDNRRRPIFDYKKETVQMLGRWQPWHQGHRALFERAISKTGQVCIMIRDCQGWNETNPFSIEQVEYAIKKDLDPLYQGQYKIIVVPNITNITYGRNVGYIIEEELFDEDITKISATNIRKELGLK